jgi:L-asparaginase
MSTDKKILIINTGGTFNKFYDPIKGKLKVDKGEKALKSLTSKWLCDFEIMNIIGKDSLEMSSHDRLELLAVISQSSFDDIIVIHGTDSMDLTAEYLADADMGKRIILTGAMVPYSIDPVEATANFSSAYGTMQVLEKDGVFISMNGIFGEYDKIKKDRAKGCFIYV